MLLRKREAAVLATLWVFERGRERWMLPEGCSKMMDHKLGSSSMIGETAS